MTLSGETKVSVGRRSYGIEQNGPSLVVFANVICREIVFQALDVVTPLVLSDVERGNSAMESYGLPSTAGAGGPATPSGSGEVGMIRAS